MVGHHAVTKKYNPKVHYRRSIRLRHYDYAQVGMYFVTIVAQDRRCLFGEVFDGEMRLNDAGGIIQTAWEDLPNHCASVEIDAFVVMPNHVHGIIVLVGAGPCARPDRNGQPRGVAPTKRPSGLSLPDVVQRFNSLTTNKYMKGVWPQFRVRLWQRNYFEHVIRNEESLNRIRQYIVDNPARWDFDRENPAATNLEPELTWLL